MKKLTNRILLIDDNPDNLDLLSDLIQHAFPGYTCLLANSGVKGLVLAGSEDPDLIMLDVVMPVMNGFEVCQKLKSDPETSHIPVVFVTAIRGDREARLQAIEVGADAFLSRPVDESELKAQIRAMQKIKNSALLQQDEKENLTRLVALQTQALQETHSATLNLLDDLHAENEARKKNEAALRDSEDKFRYLFDYSVAPKSVTQLSGVMQVNQAFCDMLGYSRGELENKSWQELSHPEDLEMNQKAIDTLLSGEKESIRLTKRYLHKNGSIVWVDLGSALRRDQNGQPLYLISTFNDITERKRAEEALLKSELRFRTLFEKAPVAIYISRNGIGLYANQKDLQMFGLSSAEGVLGRPVTDFLAPETVEASQERTRRRALGLPTPREIETVGLRPDGSQFSVQVIVDSVQLPDGPANLSFISDITERKQARALQEAVYQIAAAAETSISLDELYPKIHQCISSVMPAENFYISLYDEVENILRFSYFKDGEDEPFMGGIQPGKGLTAYVLRTGKALLCTQDVHDELERQGEVKLLGVPSAIWLGVPLIVDGKTIGAMVVQHYTDPQAYGERELHMLEFVSSQVAIAITRKQAEEALRASEARYHGLFEHSPISLWEEDFSEVKRHIENIRQSGVTDFHAFFESHPQELLKCISEIKVLDVNAATLTLMHAANKDQLTQNLQQVYPADTSAGFVDEFVSIAEGQIEFAWESPNYTLDGQKLTFSLQRSAEPGYEDTLEKVLISVRDITARKQADEALRESEEKYRKLFNNSEVGMFRTRLDGSEILEFNEKYLKILGYTFDEIAGKPSLDIWADQRERDRMVQMLNSQGEVNDFECVALTKLGEPRTCITSLRLYPDQGILEGSILDITERKRTEEEITTILRTTIEGYYLADQDGRILDTNESYCAMIGYSRAELLEMQVEEIEAVDSPEEIKKRIEQIKQTGSARFETRHKRKDGKIIDIEANVNILFQDQPKICCFMRDITDRKQVEDQIRQLNASLEERVAERTRQLSEAQEQLVRNEKLATLGQLAGGVGHELRNPLGVINSAVYYLKLVQPDADENIKKYHGIIEQEVNTASRIINDLLDFGRIVSPDRQLVSIPDLLQHMLTRFPVPPAVHLQLALPASLPKVFVDPIQLEQVLGNLTTNACQAMRECKDGGSLVISASRKKDQVAISVKDTGTGITPAALQRMFEPLFTTKLRGIGLGLAVSKKLTEANGGSITVRSQPGEGATFTVTLPVKT